MTARVSGPRRIQSRAQNVSINHLAELIVRAPRNLSHTLKTMERYGLVELRQKARHGRPVAKASEFLIRAA